MQDPFEAALAARASRLGAFGRSLTHVAAIGSTNDLAAQLAGEGAAEGTIVVADAQHAGRGRRGRIWYSPPNAGLYVSVIFRPSDAGDGTGADAGTALLTLMAAVALVEGIGRATGVEVAIKWPNDLVVPGTGSIGRKVAGILAEGAVAGSTVQHVVLGFGINLTPEAYPPSLARAAISLQEASGRSIVREEVFGEVIAALASWRRRLRDEGPAIVLDTWRRHAPSAFGSRVRWRGADGDREGVTQGITPDGALLVRTDAGEVEQLVAGEITWEG